MMSESLEEVQNVGMWKCLMIWFCGTVTRLICFLHGVLSHHIPVYLRFHLSVMMLFLCFLHVSSRSTTEPSLAKQGNCFCHCFFFYYYYFYDLFEMEINCLLYQSETVLLVLLILNPICQSEPLDKCCRQPVMSDWWMNHFCWLISGKV